MKQMLCIALLMVIWLLLTWPPGLTDAAVGLFFCFLVAALVAEIYPERPQRAFDPRRWFWMLIYIPYFLYYCIKANLDVAYRVLHVDVPIRPGIVRVKTTLKGDVAKTFLANSITLTPGTLTVDISGDDLYVHWINISEEDADTQTERIVRRFEPLLRRIFE